jgi:chaperone required for assembly of F1-ATPase
MREILKDLESGPAPSDLDPMQRARSNMRQPRVRRFYKSAGVEETGERDFAVVLDGKPALTPGKKRLSLPTRAAAQLVADEFAAQGESLEPLTMPVTRLVNTAIDGVASDLQAVLEDVLRYASTDMICYRADGPERLVARQAEAWDPVLDWAHQTLRARFILAEGVMHVEQPRETIALVGAHLAQRTEPFRLAALHVMTTLTGSALLALAVESRAISPADAWKAAHVDEDWNIELWGEDAEAAARREARSREMMSAAALIEALDS